jgi:hypothetical protein
MKSKLFNSLLDVLLDIILWIMREKEDYPAVPSPIRQPQTRKEAGCLAAADELVGLGGIKMPVKQPKSNYYRALYRIDR